MKLTKRILDNYFNDIFKKNLKREIEIRFILDIDFEHEKNGMCDLLAKPVEYKNYTGIYSWHKGDSLNHLINLQKIEVDVLIERIKSMNWGVYK